MPPSTVAAGTTAVQDAPQESPGPGGCELYHPLARQRNGVSPRAGNGACHQYARAREGSAAALKSTAPASNSVRPTEFRELMEEPPGGHNAGRRASENPEGDGGRAIPLGVQEAQARDIARAGGWTIAIPGARGRFGDSTGGISAHRGVLHASEYVDHEALLASVEQALGFSCDVVHSVYRQGRLSTEQGELRAQLDARLLALSRAGAQVHLLGKLLGLGMSPGGEGGEFCPAVRNALVRAKAAELADSKEDC